MSQDSVIIIDNNSNELDHEHAGEWFLTLPEHNLPNLNELEQRVSELEADNMQLKQTIDTLTQRVEELRNVQHREANYYIRSQIPFRFVPDHTALYWKQMLSKHSSTHLKVDDEI